MLDKPTEHATRRQTRIRPASGPGREVAIDDGIDVIFINYDEVDDLIVWLTYYKQWWEEQSGETDT